MACVSDSWLRLPMPVGPFNEPPLTDCLWNPVGFAAFGAVVLLADALACAMLIYDAYRSMDKLKRINQLFSGATVLLNFITVATAFSTQQYGFETWGAMCLCLCATMIVSVTHTFRVHLTSVRMYTNRTGVKRQFLLVELVGGWLQLGIFTFLLTSTQISMIIGSLGMIINGQLARTSPNTVLLYWQLHWAGGAAFSLFLVLGNILILRKLADIVEKAMSDVTNSTKAREMATLAKRFRRGSLTMILLLPASVGLGVLHIIFLPGIWMVVLIHSLNLSFAVLIVGWTQMSKKRANHQQVIHQTRSLLSINNNLRVLVMRPKDAFFSEADQTHLQSELDANNAQVLQDDGAQCTVITTQKDSYYLFDTLLDRCFPRINRSILVRISPVLETEFFRLVFGSVVIACLAVPFGGLSLNTSYISAWASLLWIPFFIWIVFQATFTINLGVFSHVKRTVQFWIRTTSALISFVCLVVVLQDARVCAVMLICLIQIYVAAGDAFTGAFQKLRLLFLIMLCTVLTLAIVMIYSDELPVVDFTLTISPTFDYSFIQLARDLYLGSLIVVIFDIIFALRGSTRRFAYVHRPVRFVIVPFDEDTSLSFEGIEQAKRILNHPNRAVNASQLEMKSGFLVKGLSTVSEAEAPQVRIYVDIICLKQADALVVHFLGKLGASLATSKGIFQFLSGPMAKINVGLGLAWFVALVSGPLLPVLTWAGLAFPFVFVAVDLMTCSLTMLRLLLNRRDFMVSFAFHLLWLVLSLVAFTGLEWIILFTLFVFSVLELLRDAVVRVHRRRKIVRALMGIAYLVLAAQMVFVRFPNGTTQHVYLDLRPDTREVRLNLTSYSDSMPVVDVFQQAVDLSLAVGLGLLLSAGQSYWITQDDHLELFRLPVAPDFIWSPPDSQHAPSVGEAVVPLV